MSAHNIWVTSSGNHGRTCWATDVGGKPKKKPKWQLLKCAKYGVDWEICLTDSHVYLCSARRIAISIDINSGENFWQTELPEVATSEIAICDSQVCIAPYILSQETGLIHEDLSSLGYSFRFVEDAHKDTFIITTDGDKKGVLCYKQNKHEFFDVEIYGVTYINDSRDLLGFDKKSLICYSLESQKNKWTFECPLDSDGNILTPSSSGYMVINDLVYLHTNYNTISCISLQNGSLIWKSEQVSIDDNDPSIYQKAPTRFLGCDDLLYLCRNISDDGFIQAISTKDGSETWCVYTPQARAFLIAGDLLFGALSDVPVAWDRHTGEVVWKADKPMTAIFHAVAAENKIIYTNTMSQMRCYEWTEPYHSPAKA